jgi:SAM-dependent methyltransferase
MSGDASVDLARLAGAYSHRGEEAAALRAADAADAAALCPGMLAVDVGGGGGRHAAVFAGRGAQALVVDRSPEMARAARLAGVPAVVGDGAALPVADGVADLVYFHLSIHHGPAGAWLAEARRIVHPGGRVWVWTLSREHVRTSFLAQWFPRVAELDELRFSDPADLAAAMHTLGLVGVEQDSATEEVRRSAAAWVAAVRAGFVSTLHLLDPAEIESGLAAFAAAHPDPDAPVVYSLGFRRVSATRPSLPS